MANIPGEYDLTIYKGDDFQQIFEIQDSAGDPVNLTGWSASAQCRTRQKRTGTLIVTFTVTIPSPTNGRVYLALTDTQTGAITRSAGFWDLLMTSPTDFDERYLVGEVAFEETVTE